MSTPPPLCALPGCEVKALARGWCGRHYRLWRRNGSPLNTRTVGGTTFCQVPWALPPIVGTTYRAPRRRNHTALRLTFDEWFTLLQRWVVENGTDVHRDAEVDGHRVGNWLVSQRQYFDRGTLQTEHADAIRSLGVRMELVRENVLFETKVAAFVAYRDQHGHTMIPREFIDDDDQPVGQWLWSLRAAWQEDELPEDRREALEAVGITSEYMESRLGWFLGQVREFAAAHGHTTFPRKHPARWLAEHVRENRDRLSAELVASLDEADFRWEPCWERTSPEHAIACLEDWMDEHGKVWIPRGATHESYTNLGNFAANQRSARRAGRLPEGRAEALDAIGFVWDFPGGST